MIVCSGTLLWLFSLARVAVKLTLQVGFICPFVVIDPPDIGATPGLMLDHLQPIPDAENLPF